MSEQKQPEQLVITNGSINITNSNVQILNGQTPGAAGVDPEECNCPACRSGFENIESVLTGVHMDELLNKFKGTEKFEDVSATEFFKQAVEALTEAQAIYKRKDYAPETLRNAGIAAVSAISLALARAGAWPEVRQQNG